MSRQSTTVGRNLVPFMVALALMPLSVVAQGPPCGSPPCGPGGPQLVITGAEVLDRSFCPVPLACDGILLIWGRNLGDVDPFDGTVTLFLPTPPGEQVLRVVAFDPVAQNLAAELPVGTLDLPGTFLLTVSTGPSGAETDVFDVAMEVTGVVAGPGLTGGGKAGELILGVDFLGTGAAITVARSDHGHPTLDTTCHGKVCDGARFTNLQWANLSGVPTTVKGDLLVEDGSGETRFPVGTDAQVLVADSTQPTGLRWADVAAFGGICSVPKTGQEVSFLPRDDGELELGRAWPNPRFTDNGDGTVTDNLTELIWLKDANCFGQRSWSDALSDANGLASGSCGLSDGSVAGDWRLPNIRELQSLVHYGFGTPAVPNTAGTGKWSEGDPFSGVLGSWYWSSTTIANTPSQAWVVLMDSGAVYIAGPGGKPGNVDVWLVRGGQ